MHSKKVLKSSISKKSIRRVCKIKLLFSSLGMFFIILSAVVGWMILGLFNKPRLPQTPSMVMPLAEVEVKKVSFRNVPNELRIFASTVAPKKLTVQSQISGSIDKIVIDDGETAKSGSVILQFQEKHQEEALNAAKAHLIQTQIIYDAETKLRKRGLNSKMELAKAKSNLEKAKTQVSKAQFEFDSLYIKAPFNGVVEDMNVKQGEYISSKGKTLFKLINIDDLDAVTHVSENEVQQVYDANKISIVISGKTIPAKLKSINVLPNPKTKTFKTTFSLDMKSVPNKISSLKEGLSAEVFIFSKPVSAIKVPVSYFTLNDEGVFGLRMVNSQDIVEFRAIKILQENDGQAWVSGVENKNFRLITNGYENVKSGQKVKVTKES